MSNKININQMLNNKKAQYYEGPAPSYTKVSPVLIIGIMFFCLPFLLPIIQIEIASWLKSTFNFLGLFGIIIGGLLSILKASQ